MHIISSLHPSGEKIDELLGMVCISFAPIMLNEFESSTEEEDSSSSPEEDNNIVIEKGK